MSLKFLYATDLHGEERKYEVLLTYARRLDIRLIHLGADLLPKGSHIEKKQKKFVKTYLKNYYAQAAEHGITVMGFFGNDDLYNRKKYFREYAQLLDESPVEYDGYTFNAYGYVPDYPFGLKQACKLDRPGWVLEEEYIGSPVTCDDTGIVPISDIKKFFEERTTIEEDLKELSGGPTTISAIHCPPSGLSMDWCPKLVRLEWADSWAPDFKAPFRRVGSDAVAVWIQREQPLMTLCGHIHEAPVNSGVWEATVGSTRVVQPGQGGKATVFVAIDIDGNKIQTERFVVPD